MSGPVQCGRILVVDDEPGLRFLLRSSLERVGFRVQVAGDGPEALAVAAKDGPFDVVLTDILMPGMSGVELARRLLTQHLTPACLLMSGFCPQDQLELLKADFGLCYFIQKPFLLPELLRALARVTAPGA